MPRRKVNNARTKAAKTFMITVNSQVNRLQEDYDTLKALAERSDVTCLVFGKEKGEVTQRPHLQGCVGFKETMTHTQAVHFFNQLRLSVHVHVESAVFPREKCIAYCSKGEDVFVYNPPRKQGKRNDINDLVKSMKDKGITEAAVEHPATFIKYSKGASAYFSLINRRREITKPTHVTKFFWIYGPTGIGKTSGIINAFRDGGHRALLYTLTPARSKGSTPWFDYYESGQAMLLDDWRAKSMPYENLLQLTGGQGMACEVKGGMTTVNPEFVYLTTPYSPEEMFADKAKGRDSIAQLTRRITKIIHLTKKIKKEDFRQLLEFPPLVDEGLKAYAVSAAPGPEEEMDDYMDAVFDGSPPVIEITSSPLPATPMQSEVDSDTGYTKGVETVGAATYINNTLAQAQNLKCYGNVIGGDTWNYNTINKMLESGEHKHFESGLRETSQGITLRWTDSQEFKMQVCRPHSMLKVRENASDGSADILAADGSTQLYLRQAASGSGDVYHLASEQSAAAKTSYDQSGHILGSDAYTEDQSFGNQLMVELKEAKAGIAKVAVQVVWYIEYKPKVCSSAYTMPSFSDPSWDDIVQLLNTEQAFPVAVKGHSFFKNLLGAVKTAAQVGGVVGSILPGSLGAKVSGISNVVGGIANSF